MAKNQSHGLTLEPEHGLTAEDIFETEFYSWTTSPEDEAKWRSLLSNARTQLNVSNRHLITRVEFAKEIKTASNRDKLEEAIEHTSRLSDLLSTITEAFVDIWANQVEREEFWKGEDKISHQMTHKAKKDTTSAINGLKAITTSVADNEARLQRRQRRSSQDEDIMEHTNDPPDRLGKVNVALDIKPERYENNMDSQEELEEWIERAQVYFIASKINTEVKPVQFGYLRVLASEEVWTDVKQHIEVEKMNTDNIGFSEGLDIIRELWHKTHDIYSLRMKCMSKQFQGKTYADLLRWFYEWSKEAKLCNLLNMSEEEHKCFVFLSNMPTPFKITLLAQNTRPTLQQVTEFVERQSQVEQFCKNNERAKKSRRKDTINNIPDISCFICGGPHIRPKCPDLKRKGELKCNECGKTGHLAAACRSRNTTRSSRESSTTSRTTNTSAPTSRSSSPSTSPERSRRKEKKNKKKESKRRSDRTTSEEDRSSGEERRKRRAGRTPSKAEKKEKKTKEKKKKKKHRNRSSDTVDNLEEEEENTTNEIAIKGKRSIQVGTKREQMQEEIMTLDSGSKHSILDEKEAKKKGWKVKPISDYENPNLKNADGTKFIISGKADVWIRLSPTTHKRRISFLITPKLESVYIIGLKDLRRLHWLPASWPADIENWIHLFREDAKSEPVNNLTEEEEKETSDSSDDEQETSDSSDDEEETEAETKGEKCKQTKENKKEEETKPEEERNEAKEKTDKNEEEEEDDEVKLSSLMDVKTYKDIPNFTDLPDWLQETIQEHAEVFSNDENVPQRMNVEPLKLKVKPDVKPPDQHLTASLPPVNLRKSADKLIYSMLRRNLIGKADRHTGPTSRAFFKAKRNGEARLLIDYKKSKVNSMLEKPVQPQFSVDQLVSEVPPGMKFFFSADISDAYFCYPLAEGEEGADLTVFLTHLGKFKFNVMPQGMCVSQFALGETLTEMMDHEDLKKRNEGDDQDGGNIILVDDIGGFARSEDKIKTMVKTFFRRCREYNIKLNPSKFQFGKQIHFGGLIMSEKGLIPDDKRMTAMRDFPRPKTKKQVSSFLGTATSLAAFTSTLLQDCKELRNLTKKDTPFKWENKHEAEFQTIKERLSDPALLHHYEPGMPIAIDIDTSVDGVGYTCYSYDPNKGPPGPQNAKLIRCGSGMAKESWRRYSVIELESTGCLLAARRLQHYLTNNKEAIIRNDHLPFVQAYNNRDLSEVSPRLRRIFMELRDLGIQILWCPAAEMAHSDGFSRNPVDSAESLGPDPIDDKFHRNEKGNVNNIVEDEDIDDESEDTTLEEADDPLYNSLYQASEQHEGYTQAIAELEKKEDVNWKTVPTGAYQKQLKDIWNNISISQNSRGQKLMVLDNQRYIVPPPAVEEVLEVIDVTHCGFPKALGFATARYWFPNMKQIIEKQTARCMTCQIFSRAKPQEDVLPPHPDQDPDEPFQVIFTDEFSFESKNYLVVVCALTGYSRIYHLSGKRTAQAIIKILKQFCLDYGFPAWLGTDGAKIFTSYEFQDFLKQNKIRHRLSSPMHAQSSGRHEERVSAYKQMLKKLKYEDKLTEAEARWRWELINNLPSKRGELSPARLAFRRERRHPSIPAIQASGGEKEQAEKQKKEKKKKQEAVNQKRSKRVKKPPQLVVGQRILTNKYSTNNKDKDFVLPGKVIKIRPRSQGRSAVIELADGTTTIRNRKMCIIDQDQPQPDTVNNIEQDDNTYIKLLAKDREKDHIAEVYLDNTIQKLKARGAKEVTHLKDLGSHHMMKIQTQVPPKSILTTRKTFHNKKLRFKEDNNEEGDTEDNDAPPPEGFDDEHDDVETSDEEGDKEEEESDESDAEETSNEEEANEEKSTNDEDTQEVTKSRNKKKNKKTKGKEKETKEREKTKMKKKRKSRIEEEKRANSAVRKRSKKKKRKHST